jgi:hypothetical protein
MVGDHNGADTLIGIDFKKRAMRWMVAITSRRSLSYLVFLDSVVSAGFNT